MTVKDIANIIPTMQSVALVSENIRFAKKKKKKMGDFVSMGATNIVGATLIKAESDFIAGM
jgi:hypothetical protein